MISMLMVFMNNMLLKHTWELAEIEIGSCTTTIQSHGHFSR
jgi:hypothetical protein